MAGVAACGACISSSAADKQKYRLSCMRELAVTFCKTRMNKPEVKTFLPDFDLRGFRQRKRLIGKRDCIAEMLIFPRTKAASQ